jgi:uncharacterized membrane protein
LRYISIDLLGGLAILLMIQVHFVDNLSSRVDADSWLTGLSTILGWIPAPLFTLISGASYALWLQKQGAAGRKETDANIKTKLGVKSTVDIVRVVLLRRLVEALSKEAGRRARSN